METKNTDSPAGTTKQKIFHELWTTAVYILIVLGVTFLLIKFVGQRTVVEGSSMEPSLHSNDSLWVDKISYRFSAPKRFDIVVFPPNEDDDETYYIKRIIGLPGETVQIKLDGTILINGEPLEESYGLEVIDENHILRAAEPILLGDDEYFVMGDNRNNSRDSRFSSVGNVHKSQFIGKAVFRFWPFKNFGKLK